MFRIIILSGVERGFEVLRHQVVELLGHTLFLCCCEYRSTNLIQDISASDCSKELNLGIKMFRIITLSRVEHTYKVLRRQIVQLLGKDLFLRSRE